MSDVLRRTTLVMIVAHLALPIATGPAASNTAQEPSEKQVSDQALALARERLSLSDEQAERFGPLLAEHFTNLRAVLEQYTGQGAAVLPSLMHEFKETRDNFQRTVAPILTEEQREAFAVVRKEVDQAIHDLICDKRVATLKDRLNLTDQQVVAVRPIIVEDFERRRAIMTFHTTRSGGPATRRPLGPEIQEVQDATEKRLQEVLTSEQMKEYSLYLDEVRDKTGRRGSTGR